MEKIDNDPEARESLIFDETVDSDEESVKPALSRRSLFCLGAPMVFLMICTLRTVLHESHFLHRYMSKSLKPAHASPHSSSQLPLRILALGDFNCAGTALSKKEQPYPHMIDANAVVMNLANHKPDSMHPDYISRCVQSTLSEALSDDGISIIHQQQYSFDLIMVDYAVDTDNILSIELLLKRLRARYPVALIVYVHTWKPLLMIENGQTGQRPINDAMGDDFKFHTFGLDKDNNIDLDIAVDWMWNKDDLYLANRNKDLILEVIAEIQGFLFEFPLHDPKSMFHYYMKDMHHLNSNGHALIAEGIQKVIKDIFPQGMDRKGEAYDGIGSWGAGDQCFSWFESGKSTLTHTDAKIKQIDGHKKYAHEMKSLFKQTSSITFQNLSPVQMPLSIVHMVWRDDYYPVTKAILVENEEDITATYFLDTVNPIPAMREFHERRITTIGQVSEGRHTVIFQCLDETGTKIPFRAAGIIMCGVCSNREEVDELIMASKNEVHLLHDLDRAERAELDLV